MNGQQRSRDNEGHAIKAPSQSAKRCRRDERASQSEDGAYDEPSGRNDSQRHMVHGFYKF